LVLVFVLFILLVVVDLFRVCLLGDFIFNFGFISKDFAHHFDPPDGVALGLVHEALVAAVAAHGVRLPLEATTFYVARDATEVSVHPPLPLLRLAIDLGTHRLHLSSSPTPSNGCVSPP
jgi:hypothetical protein